MGDGAPLKLEDSDLEGEPVPDLELDKGPEAATDCVVLVLAVRVPVEPDAVTDSVADAALVPLDEFVCAEHRAADKYTMRHQWRLAISVHTQTRKINSCAHGSRRRTSATVCAIVLTCQFGLQLYIRRNSGD